MSVTAIESVKIASADTCSFWLRGNDVYRLSGSECGFDIYGLPLGARWECSHEHWARFRSVYSWAQDVAA